MSAGFVLPEGTEPLPSLVRHGEQHRYRFPNGFGASVVRGPYTYGGPEGFWELAVLDADGSLTYDTPVTSDVIGWLTEEAASAVLAQIAALPAGAPTGGQR